MTDLYLPRLAQLDGCRTVLIAGAGGGFDVFCGLPLYFALQAQGFTVHLANYSFSDLSGCPAAQQLTSTLVGVTTEYARPVVYFPELYLARWFKERLEQDITIWAFAKTGAQPLRANYARLIKHLNIDALILVDGGVDSLACGTEAQPGTIIEDSVTLAAVRDLALPTVLACVGLGAEQDLTYAHIFENMAHLMQAGALLGACALTEAHLAYRDYADAVQYAHNQLFQDPSIINASIISAVRGHYGDFHLTERTRGSQLWISPLMSLYWFFNAQPVIARNRLIEALLPTHTFREAIQAAAAVLNTIGRRRPTQVPL